MTYVRIKLTNIPPCVAETPVGRNEPMKAPGQQISWLDPVFYWLVPAHQTFRHIGRDVRCNVHPSVTDIMACRNWLIIERGSQVFKELIGQFRHTKMSVTDGCTLAWNVFPVWVCTESSKRVGRSTNLSPLQKLRDIYIIISRMYVI